MADLTALKLKARDARFKDARAAASGGEWGETPRMQRHWPFLGTYCDCIDCGPARHPYDDPSNPFHDAVDLTAGVTFKI